MSGGLRPWLERALAARDHRAYRAVLEEAPAELREPLARMAQIRSAREAVNGPLRRPPQKAPRV